jgi:signal transduction histidine kinase/CheY-like chemotaxis protein
MDQVRENWRRSLARGGWALALLMALVFAYWLSRQNFPLFHTLVELARIGVAVGIFLVFWNTRQFLKLGYFLFLGVAFAFVAGLDLVHALSYQGVDVLSDDHGNVPTQLWIAARYLEAGAFLVAPLFLRRRVYIGVVMAAFGAITAFVLASIFAWQTFPHCFTEGVGLTPFKVVSEYVICGLFACSLALLVQHRGEFDVRVFRLLAGAIAVTIGAELVFTAYLTASGDANFVGHTLELVAFYLFYKAMIEVSLRRPYTLLFRDLRQSQEDLRHSVERLELLSGITAQLLASRDPRAVIQAMCEKVMEHLGCHAFFAFLIDEQRSRVEVVAQKVVGSDAESVGFPDCARADCGGNSRLECCVQGDGFAQIEGPRFDPIRTFSLTAYACHPLVNQGRTIGTLAFGSRTKAGFEAAELALMRAVADQVAIAVERERLFESIERRAAEAQAANVAKSRFLANTSHELRTPMNAILGMTDLALGEELTPAVRDYLQTAKDAADLLLELLNEILDFSRMEAGQLLLAPVPFNLRPLLEQTLKTLGIRAYQKGLELVCDVAPDVPDQLIGDSLRIRQILVNLVGNAIKFTRQGEIVVSVEVESREPDGVCLKFAVEDTGIGISPEARERIFAPFAQADSSTTRDYGGTGLGLAIVSGLVQMLHGRIWVQSQPGLGSKFQFTLPLGLADGKAVPERLFAGVEHLRDLPVLVIDDHPTSRRILAQILSNWSMKPELVPDVPTALAKLHDSAARGCRFPLLLVDAMIPGIDGVTLAGWLKGKSDLVGAMILMASVADRPALAERLAGVSAMFVEKPISQSELFAAVVRAIGGAAPASVRPSRQVEEVATPPVRLLRILLAEDTPANQKLVIRILEKRGHAVEVADNGRKAIEEAARQPFDAILMDVQMPVMDGFQATAAIRSLENGNGRAPIIAMTAHAMKGDLERCLEAGMDAYLAKPINRRELIEVVERLAR